MFKLTRIAAAARGTPYQQAVDPHATYSVYDQRYDLLEMRVWAATQTGTDLHRAMAAEMFSVPYNAVTEEQRRAGKLENFRAVYGPRR